MRLRRVRKSNPGDIYYMSDADGHDIAVIERHGHGWTVSMLGGEPVPVPTFDAAVAVVVLVWREITGRWLEEERQNDPPE